MASNKKLLTVCVYTEPDENGNRRHIPFAAEINETSSMMKISVRAVHMLGGHHGSGSSFQLYWFVDETTNCWDDFVAVSHDLGEFDIVLSQDQIERVELSTMESVGILSRRRTKKQRQHTQQQTDEHRSRAQAETARDRDEYIRNWPAELDNESGRWYRAWSANGMVDTLWLDDQSQRWYRIRSRNGNSEQHWLDQQSRQFYRVVVDRNGQRRNEWVE